MVMAMNMRPAASNRQRPSIHPVYEDFRPLMEPKQDPQSNIIHIHLPGFLKEQIRIVAENGRGVVRIRGERLIGANKWIRFLEEVPVPEFCDMAEITAKFEGEVLRITMPKKIAAAPQTVAPIPDVPPPVETRMTPGVQWKPRDDAKPKSSPQLSQTLAQEEAEPRKGGIEAEKQRTGAEIPGEESAECEAKERLKEDEEYRKAVKGVYWRRLETKRKLLMNVGVAVLVIAAFCGCGWISYSMMGS